MAALFFTCRFCHPVVVLVFEAETEQLFELLAYGNPKAYA